MTVSNYVNTSCAHLLQCGPRMGGMHTQLHGDRPIHYPERISVL
jgi:hypothetical protein